MIALVVTADDYGLAPAVDDGILEAVDAGVVTATSALPGGPSFDPAPLRRRPSLAVGLHFAAGFGAGLPEDDLRAAWRAGRGCRDLARRQADALDRAVGRPPSHVDAHRHAHAFPWVWEALAELAETLGVPVRVPRDRGGASLRARLVGVPFLGRRGVPFFGLDLMGRITRDGVEACLRAVETAGEDRAEWMVHPGRVDDRHPAWDDLRGPREQELAALLDLGPWLRGRVALSPPVTAGDLGSAGPRGSC